MWGTVKAYRSYVDSRQEFIRRINNTFIGLKQDKDEI